MKKKIKPEDLHIKEELANGFISAKVETTRNTCSPTNTKECIFPYHCDTTMTDQTFNGCNSIVANTCDQSLLCQSAGCVHTQGCVYSFSAAEVCCPLSDGKGDCNTTVCQEYPSVDVCPATDFNCKSVDIMCDKPISEDFDCVEPINK